MSGMASSKNANGKQEWKDMVKKEYESLEKAKPFDPSTPFAKTDTLSGELVDGLNKAIGMHFDCAAIMDSASAYFGSDNTGLPAVAHHFKLCAVADRADAHKCIDFLNARGACVCFTETCAPPDSSEWYQKDKCALTCAFTKALALAKVSFCCANKLWEKALEAKDAWSVEQLEFGICQMGMKIRVLSCFVAELKSASGNMQAAKAFDARLAGLSEEFAKAAGLEAVLPSCLQLGTMKRCYLGKELAIQEAICAGPGKAHLSYERSTV